MIVGGLTLGGLTPKYDSQGLESKIPSIGISTAEAKTTNPDGYEVPDLTGLTPNKTFYEKDKETGLTYKGEIFLNVKFECNNQHVMRLSRDGKIFAYVIDKERDKKVDYAIVDRNGEKDTAGNRTFEDKYDFSKGEKFPIPKWAR